MTIQRLVQEKLHRYGVVVSDLEVQGAFSMAKEDCSYGAKATIAHMLENLISIPKEFPSKEEWEFQVNEKRKTIKAIMESL